MRTSPPLTAPIFRSEGQARLLSTILLAPQPLSLVDVAALAGVAYPTAHREADRLLLAGILIEERKGRTRLLSANPDSALVPPLREIVLIATGPVVLLAEELSAIAGIQSAFLYGSFAARVRGVAGSAPHDVDVMIVGAPDARQVYGACDRVQEVVHLPVNPTILSPEELEMSSGFLDRVRADPIVPIVGPAPWPSRH